MAANAIRASNVTAIERVKPRPSAAAAALLETRGVSVHFGGIVALDRVSFAVPRHQLVGLIGPNGAGKTTMFNCFSRLYTPVAGDILFEDRTILDRPPHAMANIGVARTFQNLALFGTMSVFDNIRAGSHPLGNSDFLSNALRLPRVRHEAQMMHETAQELIEFLDLGHVRHRPAADLPFGVQKRVELARALAAKPKLLLLDEPAGGLNHHEVSELGNLIRRLRDERDVTVLLVEHHMHLVMSICDTVVALDFGRKIAEGTPAEVQQHPEVIRAYLGTARR